MWLINVSVAILTDSLAFGQTNCLPIVLFSLYRWRRGQAIGRVYRSEFIDLWNNSTGIWMASEEFPSEYLATRIKVSMLRFMTVCREIFQFEEIFNGWRSGNWLVVYIKRSIKRFHPSLWEFGQTEKRVHSEFGVWEYQRRDQKKDCINKKNKSNALTSFTSNLSRFLILYSGPF